MTDWIATRRRVRREIGGEDRYRHTVRVARTAERLARAHGVDAASARSAALLHDLTRLWSKERLLREAHGRGLALDAFELAHPVVIHAPLSAELARELFGVAEPAVLSAIRKHTLGDGEMTPLDMVIYLADALEPGRSYAGRAQMLELALSDLAAGMRVALESTLVHLASRNLTPAPKTLACARAFGAAIPKELLHA